MATPPRRALLYGGLLLHTILFAGSYLCGTTALREIPPLPLATAVLAHLFLGEHVTPQSIGGALVVISGVVLAQLRAPRTAAEVPPEPA
ncbi:MAG: hypothetical protein ACJ79H_07050 [Myxococcales bacterium]